MSVERWCVAGAGQLAALSAARWRAWPQGEALTLHAERATAVTSARELAAEAREAHVIKIEIEGFTDGSRLSRSDVAERPAKFAGRFVEQLEFRGRVGDGEFLVAESVLGLRFPRPWREYLQRPAWFRRGWLASGAYVWLVLPGESIDELEMHEAFPGGIVVGNDGSSERLLLDVRAEAPRVALANVASEGWDDAVTQASSVRAFVDALDAETFAFRFE